MDEPTGALDSETSVQIMELLKEIAMSFMMALSLSLNNLMTKKGTTVLTTFAGSIGIIGIALILSLSSYLLLIGEHNPYSKNNRII